MEPVREVEGGHRVGFNRHSQGGGVVQDTVKTMAPQVPKKTEVNHIIA